MRYKQEHKLETHQKLVEAASKEFREHGFDGIGIAKLMGELNLTHGGFYAHFSDKEQLVAETIQFAMNQSKEMLVSILAADGLDAMINYYLSEGHVENPVKGCPLPTLSSEIARHSAKAREMFDLSLADFFRTLAKWMPGEIAEVRENTARAVFSTMVGAVTVARAVVDSNFRAEILESARTQVVQMLSQG